MKVAWVRVLCIKSEAHNRNFWPTTTADRRMCCLIFRNRLLKIKTLKRLKVHIRALRNNKMKATGRRWKAWNNSIKRWAKVTRKEYAMLHHFTRISKAKDLASMVLKESPVRRNEMKPTKLRYYQLVRCLKISSIRKNNPKCDHLRADIQSKWGQTLSKRKHRLKICRKQTSRHSAKAIFNEPSPQCATSN